MSSWKDGEELVEYLVHNVLEQKEVELVSVTRVPEMKTEDRNRLMGVTLRNRNMKMKVLRVAANLRSKDEWEHEFIRAKSSSEPEK